MPSVIRPLDNLVRQVRYGQACRYVQHEYRQAAEQSVESLRSLLRFIESHTDFNENNTVTIPLVVLDRIRDLLGE